MPWFETSHILQLTRYTMGPHLILRVFQRLQAKLDDCQTPLLQHGKARGDSGQRRGNGQQHPVLQTLHMGPSNYQQ
jgi:hypothetical protein